MHGHLTFLQLSPEFGGTKFGPFPGPEIRLGSDPSRNDITLPEALGVLPEHVKILVQTDGSYIVAPTERTAAVHVFRGSQRPRHIATATALAPGDSFALVTAEGPRFTILKEEPPKPQKTKRGDAAKGLVPSKEGLWAEMKRVGFAMFFRNRIGNFVMRAWTMVKSGTIFSPRYIVAFLMMSTGWLAAIGAAVAGIFAFIRLGDANDEIVRVEDELAECQAFDVEDPDVFELTRKILGDTKWVSSLKDDDDLRSAYLTRLRILFGQRGTYRWVYTQRGTEFTDLNRAFKRALGDDLARVFSYLAAEPGYGPPGEWVLHRDTARGEEVCGRGPARMTYLQARQLGLMAAPDVAVRARDAERMDEPTKRSLLLSVPGLSPDEAATLEGRSDEILDGATADGSFACLHLDGEDERVDLSRIGRSVAREIGPAAGGLPSEGANYWITSRLLKWHAADADLNFSRVSWTSGVPSVALEALGSDAQKDRIIKAAAETIARAVAIPCMASLDREAREDALEVLSLDELPTPYICLYIEYLAEEG